MRTLAAVLGLLLAVEGRAENCLRGRLQPTFRQVATESHAVFWGTVLSAGAGKAGSRGETVFRLDAVLKTDGLLVEGRRFTLPWRMPAGAGSEPQRFLVFCDKDVENKTLSLRTFATVQGPRSVEYVRRAIAQKPGTLAFFFHHLEDGDPRVSEDAHREFGLVKHAEVLRQAGKLDPALPRRWLRNPDLAFRASDRYGLLLGACGNSSDLPLLRSLLSQQLYADSSGLLTAYLLLAPREGVAHLKKMLAAPEKPCSWQLAALRASRLVHEQRALLVSREALGELLALALLKPEVADTAAEDLRQLKFWDMAGQVLAVTRREAFAKRPCLQRAVLFYCMQCPGKPAAAFVEKMRRTEPDWISTLREQLEQEKQAETKPVSR